MLAEFFDVMLEMLVDSASVGRPLIAIVANISGAGIVGNAGSTDSW